MVDASSHFQSACEKDFDNFWIIFLTSSRFMLKQLRLFALDIFCVIVDHTIEISGS